MCCYDLPINYILRNGYTRDVFEPKFIILKLWHEVGFEPATPRLLVECSTDWAISALAISYVQSNLNTYVTSCKSYMLPLSTAHDIDFPLIHHGYQSLRHFKVGFFWSTWITESCNTPYWCDRCYFDMLIRLDENSYQVCDNLGELVENLYRAQCLKVTYGFTWRHLGVQIILNVWNR